MTTEHEHTQTEDVSRDDQPQEGDQMTAESTAEADYTTTHVENPETVVSPPAPPQVSAGEPLELSSESRNWATFAHLSAFVMFLGIPSLIGPLVVWLAKKDDPYVEAQAKEALNFNISMLIYAIAAGISILLVIGIIALPAVFIAWFVLVIVAAIRSADGEQYRYPFTIRLVS